MIPNIPNVNIYNARLETDVKPDKWEKIGRFFIDPYQKQNGYTEIKLCREALPVQNSIKKTDQSTYPLFNFFYKVFVSLMSFVGTPFLYLSSTHQEKCKQIEAIALKNLPAITQPLEIITPENLREKPIQTTYLPDEFCKYSFIDHNYAEYIKYFLESNENQKNTQFIKSTFEYMLNDLEQSLSSIEKILNKQLDSKLSVEQTEDDQFFDPVDSVELIDPYILLKNQVTELKDKILKNITECQQNLIQYPEILQETTGILNMGNTCYINAALQPLIAISHFENLLPATLIRSPIPSPLNTEEDFEKKQAILKSIKEFFKYIKEEANPKPENLGQLVARLRIALFNAGLLEGAGDNGLYSTQDAGLVFQALFHLMGLEFTLKNTQIFKVPDGHSDKQVEEKNPASMIVLKQTKKTALSIQNLIEEYSKEVKEELNLADAYRHQVGSKYYHLTEKTEQFKIESSPPPVLVFKTRSQDFDRIKKCPINHVYSVKERDLNIDCSSLFEKEHNAHYELVGFSQQSRGHWTSVVKQGDNWVSCNDSTVTKVSFNDKAFKKSADYMIYKLVQN